MRNSWPINDRQQQETHKMMKRKHRPQRQPQRREKLMPEQDFYMRIEDPMYFRRGVLEASKSSLSVLKGIHAIKDLRQRKMEKLLQLQRQVREIRLLVQKAEELLPKYTKQQAAKQFPKFAEPKKEEHHPKKEEAPKKKEEPKPQPRKEQLPAPAEKPVVQRTMTEIERLSHSIAKIEQQIKQLPELKPRPVKSERPMAPPSARAAPPAHADDKLGADLGKALESIRKKLKDI